MHNNGDAQQFKLDMIKDYVIARIDAISSDAKAKGVNLSGQFGNVAAFTGGGDGLNLMGSLIFDMYIWDTLATALDTGLQAHGLIDDPVCSTTFNNVVVAGFDAYSMINDDESRVSSIRAGGVRAWYPKGRNKKPAIDPKLVKNFNRASNQNGSGNVEAELCVLMDVLSKLESLAASKLRDITLEKGQSVYGAIRDLHKRARKSGGMDLMFGGLRTAI